MAAAALLISFSASADIDFASLDPSSLQLVPRDQAPSFGTFWIEIATGIAAPLPCPPGDYPDAPIYALPNGQFLVDARNCERIEAPSMLMTSGSSGGGGADGPTPMDVSSNTWFSQIIITDHMYVSLGVAVVGSTGNLRTHELPVGIMFAVTSTNLALPMTQWIPTAFTNRIGNYTLSVPYDPAGNAKSFYRICAQLDTNLAPDGVPPYSLIITNIKIFTDKLVTLTWTNRQPGTGDESDAIIRVDSAGHAYLIDSVITVGPAGSYTFELPSTEGLTFIRYSAPATSLGDQFFLITSNFYEPDFVTIPYVVDTSSGRTIIEVAAYDVTDSQNIQFLGHVTGPGRQKGTLEIPGVSLWPGVDVIELRATDAAFGQSATQITITNNRSVSIVAPVLDLQTNGTNRIASSWGGYSVALEAVTTNTTGTWVIKTYRPDGSSVGTVSGPISTLGQHIIYDDGGTEATDYPDPYYDVAVSVASAFSPVTNTVRVYILPRRLNAGSITGYDSTVLPVNSGSRQFVLDTLANGLSGTFAFVYHTVDFEDGYWKVISDTKAISLNQTWGWRALQAALAGSDYDVKIPGVSGWVNQVPDRPILGLAVHAHGGTDSAGNPVGIQGPQSQYDTALTEQYLEQEWHFDKRTNAIAIGVFTGCEVGNGPFVPFILRNEGVPGQIDPVTAATKHIRPCFALAWTRDTDSVTTCEFLSYWTFYATLFGGPGPFQFSLDEAITRAKQDYTGPGGTYATWFGTGGKHLDQFAY